MTIKYYTKNVYGNEMLYLANPQQAALWRQLTGKRTITETELNTLYALTHVTSERVFGPEA